MCVFFGFLLVVCHALQWSQGREVSLFPAVLGACTIHFLLKSADVIYFGGSWPLGLPTPLMFVFCRKEVPFRHFGKVLPFRSMPFVWDCGI